MRSKTFSRVERLNAGDVPYEKIYQIAVMYLVEKKTPMSIAQTLDLKYKDVTNIIEARRQTNMWIDAIADLGRKGLIDG